MLDKERPHIFHHECPTANLSKEMGRMFDKVPNHTIRPEINSNDFVFLELVERFEFDFRRRGNFF